MSQISCDPRSFLRLAAGIGLVSLLAIGQAAGQVRDRHEQYHHPLSQNSPPGLAAGWMNAIRRYDPSWMQPLSVEVEGGGTVEVFAGNAQPSAAASSPALVAVNVGHVYRLRIRDILGLPGGAIYPTVELLDRLHPPAGHEAEFPIPVILSLDDIRVALSGQLVTRVVYLEQPQIVQQLDPLRRDIPQSVLPSENALKEADRLGRPMAIIRLGGRRPSPASPPSFYGTGGSVQTLASPDSGVVRMNGPQMLRQAKAHQMR